MYFELKNIVVKYDKITAINGVSIYLEKGEIITLIGANGAGKSSILKSITGLVKIVSGEIWFNNIRIDKFPIQEIIKLGISMAPEGRHVFPYMSVFENLIMGAYLRKNKKKVKEDLMQIYKHFPRLKERAKQQGKDLSGGEQQMVAIGRALMSKPKLLLLDEPSLGLSPILVEEMKKAIQKINSEEKVSIILVEQNAMMGLSISNRGYVLETGNMALSDESRKLITNKLVKKLYLGG
jgi:branched-chain amino acid transport system ATP-binding protein